MAQIYDHLKKIDWFIFLPVLLLIGIGLITIFSATYYSAADQRYFTKQLVYAFVGVFLMLAINFMPYKLIQKSSYFFYLLALLSLVMVLFLGVKGYGAERWLKIGPIRLQPSEFAKIATVLAVARYLSLNGRKVNQLKHLFVVFLLVLLPFALIVKQPDLGTSLVFLALIIPMLYLAGVSWFVLFVLIPPLITMLASFNIYAYVIWLFVIFLILIFTNQKLYLKIFVFLQHLAVGSITPLLWNSLKAYQKKRILTFIQPENDPQGAGYQIIQSKVAIGSGGIWGKGFLQGSQSQLNFLPAHHTDFIFSVLGEEWGFFGITIVLFIFLFLFLYLLWLAHSVKSDYSRLTIVGITTILAFHTMINIGMTIGFAPVTGLPLPFLSYGGSFLLTVCVAMGITLNFSRNKFSI
ncbi:rod shape-determining protein RodA [Caldithrix abyssi DSM 13497]|uniref:Peptidoglycan glycosyltransferase RodA n=1 Tax=Caldithrix abyssi DSM 13497 TaxID=880073 RepID=H1XSC5_CALAY|nr:rod shape-determining protein RodA [Caldithrix abyssi]APF17201.1 rod shape determining protein RodA [Caldithrix abyssi DSM 13497]EHO41337.1 rod shape-determining protein RodA [Caldithrix abyssi DSM 13497]